MMGWCKIPLYRTLPTALVCYWEAGLTDVSMFTISALAPLCGAVFCIILLDRWIFFHNLDNNVMENVLECTWISCFSVLEKRKMYWKMYWNVLEFHLSDRVATLSNQYDVIQSDQGWEDASFSLTVSHWSSVRLAKTSPSAFLCFGLGEFVEVYRAANQIEFVVTIFHWGFFKKLCTPPSSGCWY